MTSNRLRCNHAKTFSAGLTLIELVVVMVIVAVFAAISIPVFTSYIQKAKAEEAKAVVGSLATAEKAYKQRYKVFTNNIADLNVDTDEAPYFDFAVDNVAGGNTFRVTATANATGVADGLPAGGTVIYSYDISQDPRGQWSGTLY
jgi:prepilin-type N-terminal cleavage/methylation domain-containing protein